MKTEIIDKIEKTARLDLKRNFHTVYQAQSAELQRLSKTASCFFEKLVSLFLAALPQNIGARFSDMGLLNRKYFIRDLAHDIRNAWIQAAEKQARGLFRSPIIGEQKITEHGLTIRYEYEHFIINDGFSDLTESDNLVTFQSLFSSGMAAIYTSLLCSERMMFRQRGI